MKIYTVVSPMMRYMDRLLDDGTGPWEEWREVYRVEAENRHQAKWMAWKLAKQDSKGSLMRCWPGWVRDNDIHPLTGVEVVYEEEV